MAQRVFVTGLTSFTGACIGKALADSGYQTYSPLRKAASEYDGIKAKRLENASNVTVIPDCNLGDETLINAIEEYKPEIFINHAADTENYRSPDYDVTGKLQSTLGNLKQIIETLKENGCKLFIHSGSAFEPGGGYTQYGISPYGVSKKMAWDLIAYHCQSIGLPCLKIFIPNPYGHLENEDRLLPILYKLVHEGKDFTLSGADAVRNNILGDDLARYYAQGANLVKDGDLPDDYIMEIRPVGHLETQLDYVLRATKEAPYLVASELMEKHFKVAS